MKKICVILSLIASIGLFNVAKPDISCAAYPERPINIIIPFGPGGAVDIAARIMAEYFQNKHDITLNIVCKGGGAGVPAMLDVARARPDGYTFGFPALATFSTAPNVKNTGYTKDSFKAVAQVTNMWLSLSVNSDSGINNVKDLFEAAKKDPQNYNFATHGALSTQRLFMARVLKETGYDLAHIAYTSGHDVSTALLGKHVTSGFGVTINQKPYVESGDFTMIGVSSPERLPEFPNVPTFAEQFGNENFVFASSHGLLAPKRTPDKYVQAMAELVEQALNDPTVQEKFKKAGLSTDYLPPQEFKKQVDTMWVFISQALEETGLK